MSSITFRVEDLRRFGIHVVRCNPRTEVLHWRTLEKAEGVERRDGLNTADEDEEDCEKRKKKQW